MVACAASLIFSPPTFRLESVRGGSLPGDIAPIKTQDQLTIAISKFAFPSDQIGIAAKDLETGEFYGLGDDNSFDAASTQKLLIVSYMYREASNNRFDLDEIVQVANGEVQRYGTGSIQYNPGDLRFTYRELSKLMMQESDNTAAYVLAHRLDSAKIQAFADQLNLKDTSVEKNTTTAHDMVLLLEAINRKELTDPALTDEFLAIMRHTDFEDRIPARLPTEAVVSHKTGDAFDGGFHDVGIVSYGGRSYAVAIFSRGIAKPELAEVSRHIFAYFAKP